MATNEVFRDAQHLSLTVPTDTASGAPVRVGGVLNGVTQTAEGEGGNAAGKATVWLKGAFTLTVTGAVTTELQPIYIVTASNTLDVDDNSAANPLFGYALSLKSGATAGDVDVMIAN